MVAMSRRLTGEVGLGDEQLDQMGLRTPTNDQNRLVRRLRRCNDPNVGENRVPSESI